MPPLEIPFPDIDPALVSFAVGGFEFALRWYALAYIVGLILGWRMIVVLMRRRHLWPGERTPMTPEQPEELLTWMVVGVILGGRLGYVLFYDFNGFLANPSEIVKVWKGGMSFHGGFLGVIVGTLAYSRLKSLPVLQVGDAVALAAPLGLLLGRLANFVNGELYGRVTDVAWAMRFPTHNPDGSRNWEVMTDPRHPSQLYEAVLEGALLLAIMWWLAYRGWLKRPGALIGVFLVGYGAARTFVENFRQWDAHIGYAIDWGGGGLTTGQVLSLPMIVVGLAFIGHGFRRLA